MGLRASHSETLWQLSSSLPPSSGLAELFEDMENVAGGARGTGLGGIAEQRRPQALGMMEELPCKHWLHVSHDELLEGMPSSGGVFLPEAQVDLVLWHDLPITQVLPHLLYVLLRVQQLVSPLPLQLVGPVLVRGQWPVPVHPSLALAFHEDPLRCYPQQHPTLQVGQEPLQHVSHAGHVAMATEHLW